MCATSCILYFGENWHFSCFTAEWCMHTVEDEWGNSSSLHKGTIHFKWLMQRQTQVPASARQGHADNERNLLAVWKVKCADSDRLKISDLSMYLSRHFSGSGVVLSQIQQSHLEDTLENYHHFCVITCHINHTKNSANTSSLEKTTIISQTNFNKLDPLYSGNEQFVIAKA